MKKNDDKSLKLLFFAFPILAAIISLIFNANTLVSTLIFLGVPSLILSLKNKGLIKKTLLFSALFAIPSTFIVDYIGNITMTWHMPTIFPRFFDVLTVEGFLWGFLYVYFVIIYYEYFLEHKFKDKSFYPKLKYLMIIISLFFIGLSSILLINPSLLNIDYFYLKGGIIFIMLPILAVLLRFPNLYTKFLKTTAYFFYFSFIYEVTALKLNQWSFPGNQFIGWVTMLGVRFPLEELIFWCILSAVFVLSLYEFFDDDKK